MTIDHQIAQNMRWHTHEVSIELRAQIMGQSSKCFWFTGLSGSGKSTLANALDIALAYAGKKTFLLDGDNLRHGLCRDLGMLEADRTENIRRAGEVAKLMVDAGLIVLCAFISPFERDRAIVRSLFAPSQFVEVFVSTDLGVCEQRDPKGLYSKARQGLIKNFTGIDSAYERPMSPEVIVDTNSEPVDATVLRILSVLQGRPV